MSKNKRKYNKEPLIQITFTEWRKYCNEDLKEAFYFRIPHSFFNKHELVRLRGHDWIIFIYFIKIASEMLQDCFNIAPTMLQQCLGIASRMSLNSIKRLESFGLISTSIVEYRKEEKSIMCCESNMIPNKEEYPTPLRGESPIVQLEPKEAKQDNEPNEEPNDEVAIDSAHHILDVFNSTVGTHLKATEGNLKHIRARLREKYTEKDLEAVIAFKYVDWKDNDTMCKYLRPQTLFNSEKFGGYLEQAKDFEANKPIDWSTFDWSNYDFTDPDKPYYKFGEDVTPQERKIYGRYKAFFIRFTLISDTQWLRLTEDEYKFCFNLMNKLGAENKIKDADLIPTYADYLMEVICARRSAASI